MAADLSRLNNMKETNTRKPYWKQLQSSESIMLEATSSSSNSSEAYCKARLFCATALSTCKLAMDQIKHLPVVLLWARLSKTR
eukprot:5155109-Amphidinium_carterae.1